MYASNVVNLVSELWDGEQKRMTLDLENEVVRHSLVTHQGVICNP
jgi:NAD/NADP transhydrogenase alpha subunit